MAKVQPHRPANTPREVEAAIDKLQKHREMGEESRKGGEKRAPYGKSSELLRKARAVAQKFDEKAFKELRDLCIQHSFALPRTHLDRLATVSNKNSRMGIARQMIRERWSRPTLDAVIRKRFGNRHRYPKLGRLPRRPQDKKDAYAEWLRLALRVVRYGEMLGWEHSRAKRSSPAGEITMSDLPAVRKQAEAALEACTDLMEAAQGALGHKPAER